MKIEDLKIINAIFLDPNLTKVSKRFRVSQSSLSKLIQRVESDLGFRLFERKGFQGLRPTTQGLLFAERMQRFSRSWEDTLALVQDFDRQLIDVKITGPSLYMRNIFFPKWFESHLPDRYRLTHIQSRVDQISLTALASDLDLVITPSPFELEEWVPTPIFTESFALFCSAHGEPKTMGEIGLQDKFWIGYRPSHDLLKVFFHQNQIPQDKVLAYIEDVESILDIIERNPRVVSILPKHSHVTHPRLKTFPVKSTAGQKLFLMHRQQQPALQECLRTLKKWGKVQGM
jgi:DNA-binding transcriptional LysR family regulator